MSNCGCASRYCTVQTPEQEKAELIDLGNGDFRFVCGDEITEFSTQQWADPVYIDKTASPVVIPAGCEGKCTKVIDENTGAFCGVMIGTAWHPIVVINNRTTVQCHDADSPQTVPFDAPSDAIVGDVLIEHINTGTAWWELLDTGWSMVKFREECCPVASIEIDPSVDPTDSVQVGAWKVSNGNGLTGQTYVYAGSGTPSNPDYVFQCEGGADVTCLKAPGLVGQKDNDIVVVSSNPNGNGDTADVSQGPVIGCGPAGQAFITKDGSSWLPLSTDTFATLAAPVNGMQTLTTANGDTLVVCLNPVKAVTGDGVDNTDAQNPVISQGEVTDNGDGTTTITDYKGDLVVVSTTIVDAVLTVTGNCVDATDPQNPIITCTSVTDNGDGTTTIVGFGGDSVTVNNSDVDTNTTISTSDADVTLVVTTNPDGSPNVDIDVDEDRIASFVIDDATGIVTITTAQGLVIQEDFSALLDNATNTVTSSNSSIGITTTPNGTNGVQYDITIPEIQEAYCPDDHLPSNLAAPVTVPLDDGSVVMLNADEIIPSNAAIQGIWVDEYTGKAFVAHKAQSFVDTNTQNTFSTSDPDVTLNVTTNGDGTLNTDIAIAANNTISTSDSDVTITATAGPDNNFNFDIAVDADRITGITCDDTTNILTISTTEGDYTLDVAKFKDDTRNTLVAGDGSVVVTNNGANADGGIEYAVTCVRDNDIAVVSDDPNGNSEAVDVAQGPVLGCGPNSLWLTKDGSTWSQVGGAVDTFATLSAPAGAIQTLTVPGGGTVDICLNPVKTVSGDGVNNADPQNPFITQGTVTDNGNGTTTISDFAGNNVTVSNTILTPVLSITGNCVDNTDPQNPVITCTSVVNNNDGTTTITGGDGSFVTVDSADVDTFAVPSIAAAAGTDDFGAPYDAGDALITFANGQTMAVINDTDNDIVVITDDPNGNGDTADISNGPVMGCGPNSLWMTKDGTTWTTIGGVSMVNGNDDAVLPNSGPSSNAYAVQEPLVDHLGNHLARGRQVATEQMFLQRKVVAIAPNVNHTADVDGTGTIFTQADEEVILDGYQIIWTNNSNCPVAVEVIHYTWHYLSSQEDSQLTVIVQERINGGSWTSSGYESSLGHQGVYTNQGGILSLEQHRRHKAYSGLVQPGDTLTIEGRWIYDNLSLFYANSYARLFGPGAGFSMTGHTATGLL